MQRKQFAAGARRFFAALAAALLFATAAGCAGSGAPKEGAANRITVLWRWSEAAFEESPEQFDLVFSLKAEWEAKYGPDSITILDAGGWEEQRTALRRMVTQGKTVDLA
jgi:ABC-type glycerol-3-phosphate transport system substrate-binding protein